MGASAVWGATAGPMTMQTGAALNMTVVMGKQRKPAAHPKQRATCGNVRTMLPSVMISKTNAKKWPASVTVRQPSVWQKHPTMQHTSFGQRLGVGHPALPVKMIKIHCLGLPWGERGP